MTIALVTEGISEYRITKHILTKYFKGNEEIDINQMQPKLTEDEKKQADGGTNGGWVEVLKYCENLDELESIFLENDYLVLQIDTDRSEIAPYNVPKQVAGIMKTPEILYKDIVERLIKSLPESIKERFLDRVIFAICIETIECWLLPVFYADKVHCCKTNNCLFHLNDILRKKNLETISTNGDKNNPRSVRAYQDILKKLNKKKEIEDCSVYNYGFKSFVQSLRNI